MFPVAVVVQVLWPQAVAAARHWLQPAVVAVQPWLQQAAVGEKRRLFALSRWFPKSWCLHRASHRWRQYSRRFPQLLRRLPVAHRRQRRSRVAG